MDGDIRKREEWLRRNTTPEELDAFWERFPDTSDDRGAETKSVRDVQITLACGRWLKRILKVGADILIPIRALTSALGRPANT